mmetsp:Transcript_40701/g.102232  ORF Transcript_40701/g.102232 Transcript_40701/m.102232 type:complete len:255 (+) Transcript_40701:2154-2918(+)
MGRCGAARFARAKGTADCNPIVSFVASRGPHIAARIGLGAMALRLRVVLGPLARVILPLLAAQLSWRDQSHWLILRRAMYPRHAGPPELDGLARGSYWFRARTGSRLLLNGSFCFGQGRCRWIAAPHRSTAALGRSSLPLGGLARWPSNHLHRRLVPRFPGLVNILPCSWGIGTTLGGWIAGRGADATDFLTLRGRDAQRCARLVGILVLLPRVVPLACEERVHGINVRVRPRGYQQEVQSSARRRVAAPVALQ